MISGFPKRGLRSGVLEGSAAGLLFEAARRERDWVRSSSVLKLQMMRSCKRLHTSNGKSKTWEFRSKERGDGESRTEVEAEGERVKGGQSGGD